MLATLQSMNPQLPTPDTSLQGITVV
jgi:hypothetical protein